MGKLSYKRFRRDIVYQIYPRSFYDTNGDGIGDIKGITKKLPYLHDLGITAIWISPCFVSPMEDGGYDIADYYHVDPMFGKDEDLFELIEEAKKLGIGIILDLVVNHTSSEHHWFKEALKGRDNPYHDFYVWRKTPLDQPSVFGGPAYEYVPELDEYYLHNFAIKQPDLNWDNPRVKEEIWKMMNYWLDKGVYGFRIDVLEKLGKIPEEYCRVDGEKLHSLIHEMHERTLKGRETLTVGECWDTDLYTRTLYTDPEREEIDMVFQFGWYSHFNSGPRGKYTPEERRMPPIRDITLTQQMAYPEKSWNPLFWSNHDIPRPVTFFEKDPKYRDDLAKMLFGINLFLSGTPFIYNGEELGMKSTPFYSVEEMRDVEGINMVDIWTKEGMDKAAAIKDVSDYGRDPARTPIPWTPGKNGGFSTSTPWIKMGDDIDRYNVESEEKDPDSVLNFVKSAIRFRQEGGLLDTILFGEFVPECMDSDTVLAFRKRGEKPYIFVANWSEYPCKNPFKDKKILFSHGVEEDDLLPYGFAVLED